jgi:transposase
VIMPLLPSPCVRGRPRETSMREVANAIFYIAQSGCHWRMLPKEFPPLTTVQYYLYLSRDDGTWCRINHAVVMRARELAGREASPSASIIDSPSVRTTEAAGPRGSDAGKKINGRKRHLLVDTIGLVIAAIVHRADTQGSSCLISRSRRRRLASVMASDLRLRSPFRWLKSLGLRSRAGRRSRPPADIGSTNLIEDDNMVDQRLT